MGREQVFYNTFKTHFIIHISPDFTVFACNCTLLFFLKKYFTFIHLSIILTFACHGCAPASDVCKEVHCWPFDYLFLLFVLHVESTNVSNDVTTSTLWIISLGQNPRRNINRLDSMNISWVFPHIMPNCSPKGLCQF